MHQKSLKEIESEIENFWSDNKIYEKFKTLNNQSKKKFYFCQGPPFTSGEAHLGHAWNHVIKDSIIRFKSANNYDVFKRAGWDMHGLPIEVKVEQKFGLKVKKDIEIFGVDKFIEECKNFAMMNANAMTKQLKKLSVWLDWEDPYLTIDKDYMSEVWKGIKKAHEKNLLYEKERIIHWCPRCGTAMAGYEVAEGYKEIKDTAIYVKAKLSENFKINGKIYENVNILIWTTTPWTLPANVAIAVNPDIDYVLIEYNEEKIICALSALNRIFGNQRTEKKEKKKKHYKDAVLSENVRLEEYKIEEKDINNEIEDKENDETFKILEKFKGENLNGIMYESILDIPLQKEISKYHKIVLAKEIVLETEGSGAVHIAPGHGEEDAKIGEKYSLPDPSPVDEAGRFTIEPYKNIFVFDANEIIIDELIKNKKLLKREKILHTYPHCWRCKTKLILRKTKQWFIAVSKIRDKLLEINDKINWIPEFIGHGKDKDGNKTGNSRFENWLKEAKDWCISRQRYWNTPLPIWKCECGNMEVIGSAEELEEKSGMKINDLHKNIVDKISFKCPKCNKVMHRVPDVMDVWLDSGSAAYANLYTSKYKENFSELYPADFITEGSDQTRGWFYSLLVMGAIVFDDISYKNVLYHGFTLDEKGVKMSKSIGNVVDPMDIINKYSVDAFRMYLLSVVPWEDLKFSEKDLLSIEKELNILLNVFYFVKTYTELDNYEYNEDIEILKFFNSTSKENKIMISLTNLLIKNVYENFEKYYVHNSVSNILDFINDLSRYYVKIIRDKVWIEKENKEKNDVYFTLCYALTNLSKVASSMIPHISEYIYKNINHKDNESVCLKNFPNYDENLIDKNLIEKFEILKKIVSAALYAREKSKIKLRWPIKKIKINLSKPIDLKDVEKIILKLTNSEEISYEKEKEIIKIKANFATIGKKFKNKAKEVANLINSINSFSDEEKEKIVHELEKMGKISLNGFEICSEDVKIEKELPEGEVGEKFDGGIVIISTEIDENLFKKAMCREVIRRIQVMRKELDLNELDVVNCIVECDEEFKKYIVENLDFIEHETRTKIEINNIAKSNINIYAKEYDIEEWKIRIGIVK